MKNIVIPLRRKNQMKISDVTEICSLYEEFNIPIPEYISYRNRENSFLSRDLSCLLGASVLSDSCGSFIYSVYGQFSRQQKPHSVWILRWEILLLFLYSSNREGSARMIDMALLEIPGWTCFKTV
ncbi:hypothetical protein AVEN_77209-1 [Araneus ventricosus]|uniref:Uncharacterized protein n=1 Tax=Araneus ventricosus TaxID=182803 RepID=A0A4Y2QGL2_ARAVE|nr:hypothetical protein AVEN_77209-1 [Araneus ventricosus]